MIQTKQCSGKEQTLPVLLGNTITPYDTNSKKVNTNKTMFWKGTCITSNAFIDRDIGDQFLHTQMFAQHRCKIHNVQSPNS
jgi:hypothetical protein